MPFALEKFTRKSHLFAENSEQGSTEMKIGHIMETHVIHSSRKNNG